MSCHIKYLKLINLQDDYYNLLIYNLYLVLNSPGIWEYAKKQGYIIVSKDNDFRQRSFLFGSPPKVIWLSVGNGGTKIIKKVLLANVNKIRRFAVSDTEGLLILEQ